MTLRTTLLSWMAGTFADNHDPAISTPIGVPKPIVDFFHLLLDMVVYTDDIPAMVGELATKTYVDNRFTTLIGAAPVSLDTLKEIADQLANDESAVASIVTVMNSKASQAALDTLTGRVTTAEGNITTLQNKFAANKAAAVASVAGSIPSSGLTVDILGITVLSAGGITAIKTVVDEIKASHNALLVSLRNWNGLAT